MINTAMINVYILGALLAIAIGILVLIAMKQQKN
jgi:hypothetical protein